MKTLYIFFLALLCVIPNYLYSSDTQNVRVIGWGKNWDGEAIGVPNPGKLGDATNVVMISGLPITNAIAIAAGNYHSLALRSDGTVVGWGSNASLEATGSGPGLRGPDGSFVMQGNPTNGVVSVGGEVLSNVVAISAGYRFSAALKRDGTIAAWGVPGFDQASIPKDLTNVVAISAGYNRCLALKSDGTLASWRYLAPDGLSNIVAISKSDYENGCDIVLNADGTVIQWNRSMEPPKVLAGLSNVVAIAAGGYGGSGLALRNDGTVVALKYHSTEWTPLFLLTNIVAIAAGSSDLALRSDGTVAAWGGVYPYRASVPPGLTNIIAIAAGDGFCLAIQTNSPGPITNAMPVIPKLRKH